LPFFESVGAGLMVTYTRRCGNH